MKNSCFTLLLLLLLRFSLFASVGALRCIEAGLQMSLCTLQDLLRVAPLKEN